MKRLFCLSVCRGLGLALVWAGLVISAGAQAGVSSASVSRSRSLADKAPLSPYDPPPVPDEIAVEEIVNYHRHRLPLPKDGQGVALDVRWGNSTVAAGQPAVLQVGLTTANFKDTSDLRPLNLVLVIDKSGSMAAEDKMSRVKQALQTFIGKLRREDKISIVLFDASASVLLPSTRLGDCQEHRRAIATIEPGSSTNLHAGLMLGYNEAQRNFNPEATNRVILLTDGIANTGVTNPHQIATESSEFNAQGIDLTTIGVGYELDNDLLKTLAKRGKGLYHFVADSRDIEKVFVDEVQSILSPVARNVRVEIEHDTPLRLEKLYGYEPRRSNNLLALDLDNLNNGATQVIMLRFAPFTARDEGGTVKVRLRYYDIARRSEIEETRTVALACGKSSDYLKDDEVRKNYNIAQIAQALHDMRECWSNRDYRAAENILRTALSSVRECYPRLSDKDLRAQVEVAERYLASLSRYNNRPARRNCSGCPEGQP